MCTIWVTDSSDYYSHYEKQLICDRYTDAKVEELKSTEVSNRIVNENPDAVILDNKLPFINGADLIDKIEKFSPNTKIIVSSSDRRHLDELKDKSIMVLQKPINVSNFLAVVGQVYYG